MKRLVIDLDGTLAEVRPEVPYADRRPVPEMVEVEAYRRTAERALGRPIAEVVAPDDWYLKRGLTAPALQSALTGRRLTGARRLGKLLLLDVDDGAGPVVGLRFGMRDSTSS